MVSPSVSGLFSAAAATAAGRRPSVLQAAHQRPLRAAPLAALRGPTHVLKERKELELWKLKQNNS